MQELEVKVTRIGKRWHARLIVDGSPVDEMACALKSDIGYICHQLMRWYDKLGGVSKQASASRCRLSASRTPAGKIWWHILEHKV